VLLRSRASWPYLRGATRVITRLTARASQTRRALTAGERPQERYHARCVMCGRRYHVRDEAWPQSDPALRASDADRERVAERLREHVGAGRLSMDELSERLETVFAARTLGELEPPLADLPSSLLLWWGAAQRSGLVLPEFASRAGAKHVATTAGRTALYPYLRKQKPAPPSSKPTIGAPSRSGLRRARCSYHGSCRGPVRPCVDVRWRGVDVS